MLTEAKIEEDLKSAMRARDMPRVYVLRGIVAAVKNLKVEKQVREIAEADLVAIVRKEVSKRIEAASYGEKGGRAEVVAQNRAEQEILEAYLPRQLSATELEELIKGLSAELGTTQIGPLMAALRQRHGGQFDGKLASELIRKLTVNG